MGVVKYTGIMDRHNMDYEFTHLPPTYQSSLSSNNLNCTIGDEMMFDRSHNVGSEIFKSISMMGSAYFNIPAKISVYS